MNQTHILLKKAFNKKLPGPYAQNKMAPSLRFTGNELPDPSIARESSVFVLIYYRNNSYFIPLIKRQKYKGAHSGQISLPGGKQEPIDKTLLHTAYRETYEEIGIEEKHIRYVGSLSPLFIPNSNFNVTPHVGYINTFPKFIKDHREVEEIIEMPIKTIFNSSAIKKFSRFINGKIVQAPYYLSGHHQIWGATAMILSEFAEVIKSTDFVSTNPLSHFYNDCNAQEYR
ncbi:CoA pyrophosphatase [Marinilabiliaceae bacterium JC017]|nr:CoA pyrophosphatase [Marinilabiliaceae bacterium JC017]